MEDRLRERLANNGRNSANNYAGVVVGSDLHYCEILLAEIDRLRAELAREKVRGDREAAESAVQCEVRLEFEAECARLRAEIADEQKAWRAWQADCTDLRAKVADLTRLDDAGYSEITKLRAVIAKAHDIMCLEPNECDFITACRHTVENMVEGEREAKRLRAAARQDAETIARLREALEEISCLGDIRCDEAGFIARAALAPRPPEGKAE